VSLLAPAIAMGNRVVLVPSWPAPLAATDLYQVLDTSDVPGRRGEYRHRRSG
jgi:aldehyde dehydrogenase (NAD+)